MIAKFYFHTRQTTDYHQMLPERFHHRLQIPIGLFHRSICTLPIVPDRLPTNLLHHLVDLFAEYYHILFLLLYHRSIQYQWLLEFPAPPNRYDQLRLSYFAHFLSTLLWRYPQVYNAVHLLQFPVLVYIPHMPIDPHYSCYIPSLIL